MSASGLHRLDLGRRRRERAGPAAPYTPSETVVLLVVAVAGVGGLINAASALEHLGTLPRYAALLAFLAAVQIGWVALTLRRPSLHLLLFGCAWGVVSLGLWLAAQTMGLSPAGAATGSQAWLPGGASTLHALFWCASSAPGSPGAGQVPQLVGAVGEVAIVIALASVLRARHGGMAEQVCRRIPPVLVAILFASVLYGAGANAG